MNVESADVCVKRAAELGGKILAGPFDVYDAGRMAVLQDPTGAAISVWQANKHIGARVVGVPGTFCVADLMTGDQEAAANFYEKLFAWKIGKEDEEPQHRYYHIFNGQQFIGGIPPASFRDPSIPPHWQVYILVADCAASVERAKKLGAQVFLPPTDIEGIGWISVMADPQGAVFALFEAARAH